MTEDVILSEPEALERFGAVLSRGMEPADIAVEYSGFIVISGWEERLRVYRPGGTWESVDDPYDAYSKPFELIAAFRALRAACYRPGIGTWFSARVRVDRFGVSADYNYDDEPDWNLPPDAWDYVRDFERFPRDEEHTPTWLKEKLEIGRARGGPKLLRGRQ